MTVQEIIKKYLRDNGFDGLCNDDCGCGIDDFAPCDSLSLDCNPAYKCNCKHDECDNKFGNCYTTSKENKCWMMDI